MASGSTCGHSTTRSSDTDRCRWRPCGGSASKGVAASGDLPPGEHPVAGWLADVAWVQGEPFSRRTVGFVNIEFRTRFADFDLAGQNLTLTAAPFLDLGSVGDKVMVVAPTIRAAAGAGLRIGWNRSTVVVADAAFSREDAQFFINFNQSY